MHTPSFARRLLERLKQIGTATHGNRIGTSHLIRKSAILITIAALSIQVVRMAIHQAPDEPVFSATSPIIRVRLKSIEVKIGVSKKKTGFRVEMMGTTEIRLLSNRSTKRIDHLNEATITQTPNGLALSNLAVDETGFVLAPLEGVFKIGEQRFRGHLRVQLDGEDLVLINELDLEAYLRGVIGVEMSPTFPTAALEAQAIVARTYALSKILKNEDRAEPRPWDLTDGSNSQVYGGRSVESRRTDRAVGASQGIVLYRDEELSDCYYHSSCGGHTSNQTAVFSGASDNETDGVECTSCRASDRVWSVDLDERTVRRAVRSCGISGLVTSVSSGQVDSGGRWIDLKVKTDRGVFTVPANRFRLAVGGIVLKSTMIEKIVETRGGISIVGRGFGHGVGLCQTGARDLGLDGMSSGTILRHYYRDSTPRRAYGKS